MASTGQSGDNRSRHQLQAEGKARNMVAESEAKSKAFCMPWNRSSKFQDCAELLLQAAAQFKIAKMPQEAGETYVAAADMFVKGGDQFSSTRAILDAAKAFKQAHNVEEAIKYYKLTAEHQQNNNKFNMAAKSQKEIAQMYESDMKLDEALQHYRESADLFMLSDAATTANQMFLKVADIAALQEDYKSAIRYYDQVAAESADNRLTSWSVNGYAFKGMLCLMAMECKAGATADDLKTVFEKLEHYKDSYPQFSKSREAELCEKVLQAFGDDDVDAFTDAVFNFDQISTLDSWKSSILLKIKKKLEEEPDFS